MTYNPYSRFHGLNLTLTDHLAIDRTILANERTILAYARTGLALVVVGGSCIKFLDARWLQVGGFVLMIAGVCVALLGWQRYVRTKRRLAIALTHQTGTGMRARSELLDSPLGGADPATDVGEAQRAPS